MQPIRILFRRNGVDRSILVEPARQRELEQDAVNGGIGVDLAEGAEQRVLRAPFRKEVVA
jgi:hypothetical protein